MGDDKTLRRVLAHELAHHEDYMVNYLKQVPVMPEKPSGAEPTYEEQAAYADKLKDWIRKGKSLKFQMNMIGGHGAPWKEIANRFNARLGADFVTERSDEQYVRAPSNKEVFLLIRNWPGKEGEPYFVFQWAVRLGPAARKKLDKYWRLNPSFKLVKTPFAPFSYSKHTLGDDAYSREKPENHELLKQLWDTAPDLKGKTAKLPLVKTAPFVAAMNSVKGQIVGQNLGSLEIAQILSNALSRYQIEFKPGFGESGHPEQAKHYLTRAAIDENGGIEIEYENEFYTQFDDMQDYEWNSFVQTVASLVAHELTHRNQMESIKDKYQGETGAYKVDKAIRSLGADPDKTSQYLGNPHEVTAFAREAVEELRNVQYTDEQILQKLASPDLKDIAGDSHTLWTYWDFFGAGDPVFKRFMQQMYRVLTSKEAAAQKTAEDEGNPWKPWIGVDLDRTLATEPEPFESLVIGTPIPEMVKKVQDAIAAGETVKVFTARLADPVVHDELRELIRAWTKEHIGVALDSTCVKDPGLKEMWDDRAREVEENTGEFKTAGAIFDVFISKAYFPSVGLTKPGKEGYEQWKVNASSRQEAAEKVWKGHGERLLGLMNPRLGKLPRKVSLYVSDPRTRTPPGRLQPILVHTESKTAGPQGEGQRQHTDHQQENITKTDPVHPFAEEAKTGPHKNVTVQADLPGSAAAKVLEAARSIPDEELGADGREDDPHITVKFGVEDNIEELSATLKGVKPFSVTLGKLHVFTPSSSSGPQAPVVAEAHAPELVELHERVNNAMSVRRDDFPYRAHVTLAYVKPELAAKYEGSGLVEGVTFRVDGLTLSRKGGDRTSVPFGKTAASSPMGKSWIWVYYPGLGTEIAPSSTQSNSRITYHAQLIRELGGAWEAAYNRNDSRFVRGVAYGRPNNVVVLESYGWGGAEPEFAPDEVGRYFEHEFPDVELQDRTSESRPASVLANKFVKEPQFFYHSTLAKNLNSIAREGLKPSTDPQWGGQLGDFSKGKLLMATSPKGAMFYAIQLFHALLENNSAASTPVCLKLQITNEELHEDTEAQEDYWTEATIPPDKLQIWWQGSWQPLKASPDWDDLSYINRDGIWYDWEGEQFESMQEAEDDMRSYAYPKIAAGHKFVKEPRSAGDILVAVDPKKLDEVWKNDSGFYIGPGGTGQIGNRYQRFQEWLQDNPKTPIEAPIVSWDPYNNTPSFTNGRHRFSVLRDMGAKKVYIAVPKDEVQIFKKFAAREYLAKKTGSHKTPPLSDTQYQEQPGLEGEGTQAWANIPERVQGEYEDFPLQELNPTLFKDAAVAQNVPPESILGYEVFNFDEEYAWKTGATYQSKPTLLDIGNGYWLSYAQHPKEGGESNTWTILNDTDKLFAVGEVTLDFYPDLPAPSIRAIRLNDKHQQQGLGPKIVQALAKFYGGLTSDPQRNTNDYAKKMWRKIPGVQEVPSPKSGLTPPGNYFVLQATSAEGTTQTATVADPHITHEIRPAPRTGPGTGGFEVLVMDEGKEIGGTYVGVDYWQEGLGYATVRSASLPQGYRSRGFGRALYDRTIEEARKAGFTRLYADESQTQEAKRVWKSLERDYPVELDENRQFVRLAKGLLIGQAYLLHFDIAPGTVIPPTRSDATKPFHARHYLGWAEDAESRIQQHREGTAARLTQHLKSQGIGFQVAKIWDKVDRDFERRLKNQGGLSRHCPICISQGIDRDSTKSGPVVEVSGATFSSRRLRPIETASVESRNATPALLADVEAQTIPYKVPGYAGEHRLWDDSVFFSLSRTIHGAYLTDLHALHPKQGDGHRFMEWLKGIADKHGVEIHGYADPVGSEGLDTDQLLDWYKRHGFVFMDGRRMVRQPRTAASVPLNEQYVRWIDLPEGTKFGWKSQLHWQLAEDGGYKVYTQFPRGTAEIDHRMKKIILRGYNDEWPSNTAAETFRHRFPKYEIKELALPTHVSPDAVMASGKEAAPKDWILPTALALGLGAPPAATPSVTPPAPPRTHHEQVMDLFDFQKKHRVKTGAAAAPLSLLQALVSLRPQFVAVAQQTYDENVAANVEDPDGEHGICDEIAQEMEGVIASHMDVELHEGGQDGDDHAWVIVRLGDEACGVDIPPSVYETGGGYSWKLLPDVVFQPTDIEIWPMDMIGIEASIKTAKTPYPKLLEGLAAEAKKAPTFDEFEKDFIIDLKHGRYYHLTDNPNFEIDPKKGPRDMSSMAEGQMEPGKLMITSHLDNWAAYYGKARPYVAIIDMSAVPRDAYHQVKRGFGNEFWVENPAAAKVVNVMPMAAAKASDRRFTKVLEQTVVSEQDLQVFYEAATGKKVKDEPKIAKTARLHMEMDPPGRRGNLLFRFYSTADHGDSSEEELGWIEVQTEGTTAFVDDVHLQQQMRGRGEGRDMYVQVFNTLRQRGFSKVETMRSGPSKDARRVWESLKRDFSVDETEPNHFEVRLGAMKTVRLYRGMSQQEFAELKRTGIIQPSPYNKASKNPDTAEFYSKQHDDDGVIVEFEAPDDAVQEDVLYRGDFKVVKPIKAEYKIAKSRKKAFKIEVPKSVRDHFWEEPPVGNWEFWAYRSRPNVLPGEKIVFTFDHAPVATAVVHHIEEPGKTKCENTGKYEKHHKVYWLPNSFRRVDGK